MSLFLRLGRSGNLFNKTILYVVLKVVAADLLLNSLCPFNRKTIKFSIFGQNFSETRGGLQILKTQVGGGGEGDFGNFRSQGNFGSGWIPIPTLLPHNILS